MQETQNNTHRPHWTVYYEGESETTTEYFIRMHIKKTEGKKERNHMYQNPTHTCYLVLLSNLSISQNIMYLHTSRMCHKLVQEWNQLKTKTVITLSFTPGNYFLSLD